MQRHSCYLHRDSEMSDPTRSLSTNEATRPTVHLQLFVIVVGKSKLAYYMKQVGKNPQQPDIAAVVPEDAMLIPREAYLHVHTSVWKIELLQ